MIFLHIFYLRAVWPERANFAPEVIVEHWGCQTAVNARARELSKQGWAVEVAPETVVLEVAA